MSLNLWEENFDGSMILIDWINILYGMKWKGGSLWFCCIHLWWNVQKTDRENLILLKYFKEKKTLNGGKKTVEIAEVNM